MIRFLAALICALAAWPAQAQHVQPCDWIARADAIVEPWEDNTRTFANGEVRIALLDVIEPAAGAYHVLIISPPYAELGERQCRTLGMTENIGFSGVEFGSLTAEYDPSVGLVFQMPVQRFDGENYVPAWLRFTLNQATGDIRAVLQ